MNGNTANCARAQSLSLFGPLGGAAPTPVKPRPGPGQPLRARQIKRKAQRRKRRKAASAWLKRTWPHLFGKQPLPLAVGIGEEIITRAGQAGLKPFDIRAALYIRTNSRRYLEALATVGAVRWGLAGTAVDFVASEHQADARERLAALAATKAAEWAAP